MQIALSCLLVLGAFLFVRTLANLQSVDMGFNSEHLLTFNLTPSKAGYTGPALNAIYNRIETRLRELNGVLGVTAASAPAGTRAYRTPVLLPGNQKGWAGWNSVGPSFFETMQTPVVIGRSLNWRDVSGAPPSAVVSEIFAKKYFGDRSPIGEHLGILDGGKDVTIVGVAANARDSLREPFPPIIYISYNQFPAPEWRGMFFHLRTTGNPAGLAASVRSAVHEVAPDIPVANLMTQAERMERSLAQERTLGHLCTAFAILALTIACIGLYGSMAYAVSTRTKEIGIRIALGAKRGGVLWIVMREVLLLAVVGLGIGMACARAALPAIQSFLFGVSFGDLAVIACVAGVMIVCALGAGYAPARRASQLDPMQALRHD